MFGEPMKNDIGAETASERRDALEAHLLKTFPPRQEIDWEEAALHAPFGYRSAWRVGRDALLKVDAIASDIYGVNNFNEHASAIRRTVQAALGTGAQLAHGGAESGAGAISAEGPTACGSAHTNTERYIALKTAVIKFLKTGLAFGIDGERVAGDNALRELAKAVADGE